MRYENLPLLQTHSKQPFPLQAFSELISVVSTAPEQTNLVFQIQVFTNMVDCGRDELLHQRGKLFLARFSV